LATASIPRRRDSALLQRPLILSQCLSFKQGREKSIGLFFLSEEEFHVLMGIDKAADPALKLPAGAAGEQFLNLYIF
jgi:hypothetical protein